MDSIHDYNCEVSRNKFTSIGAHFFYEHHALSTTLLADLYDFVSGDNCIIHLNLLS